MWLNDISNRLPMNWSIVTMTMTMTMRRPTKAPITVLLRWRLPSLTDDTFFFTERDGLRRPLRQESHSNPEIIESIAVIISSQVRTCRHHLLYGILGLRLILIISYPLKLKGSECRHICQSAITIFYECSRYFLSVIFLSNLHQTMHESYEVWFCLRIRLRRE